MMALAALGAALGPLLPIRRPRPPRPPLRQLKPPELRAAAMVLPPIVMEQNGTLTGFSIDLWNAIAARLKLKTNYEIMPDAGHVGGGDANQRADLTVSVFITSARETRSSIFRSRVGLGVAQSQSHVQPKSLRIPVSISLTGMTVASSGSTGSAAGSAIAMKSLKEMGTARILRMRS
jgi:ABC-type amino acid transport substrate-binding protein